MRKSRFVLFTAGLAGAVALTVASVVAQSSPSERARDQVQRPRVMTLDGRGPQIGVTVEDVTEGVRIGDVDPDGPASKAGLREGDVVLELDGERVRSARQFSRLIQETAEGRSVALGVLRNGQRQSITVTPEARGFGFPFDGDFVGRLRDIEPRLRDLEPRLREMEPRLREFRFDGPMDFDMLPRLTSPRARLGVQLDELTPQLAEYFGAPDGGVLVTSVTDGSAAHKAGLKAGDVITSIDGGRVRRADDLVDELRDKDGEVTVGIVRDRKEASVKATLESTRPRAVYRRPA